MAVCICPYICASSSIGLPNCFAYTINADITPIDIIWLMAKYPPNAAIITKLILLITFITGPIEPPRISAIIPTLVSSSDTLLKSFMTFSCLL